MSIMGGAALAQPCIEGQHFMVSVRTGENDWFFKCVRCSATQQKGSTEFHEPDAVPAPRPELRPV